MAKKIKGKYIGYAREWSCGPSLDEQVARLKTFGCWNVYAESPADTSTCGRQLSLALVDVRPGDYFVVVDIACLGAPTRLVHVFTALQRDNVDFYVIAGGLDSRGPNGEHSIAEALKLLHVILNFKSQAIREGLDEARRQGRVGGRRPVMSAEKVAAANELIAGGQHTMKQIAKKLGVSRSSLYNSKAGGSGGARKNMGRPRGAAQGAVPMTGSD